MKTAEFKILSLREDHLIEVFALFYMMKNGKQPASPKERPNTKERLHPRSLHRGRYDFNKLALHCPELKPFVRPNPYGELGIDFANPGAVKIFNKALLSYHYQIYDWEVPAPFLIPPIPGRVDYIHYIADLLAEDHQGVVPTGPAIRGLDIGIGANGIYPLVGHRLYGWSFVGSDINADALNHAALILETNGLQSSIMLRRQLNSAHIFNGIYRHPERFHFTICNPPFHSSQAEAQAGSLRKVRNLSKNKSEKAVLNFGGGSQELWYPGGERQFISQMIQESVALRDSCMWFTTLVSKKENIGILENELKKTPADTIKVISMGQGQKSSRILAWSFMNQGNRNQFMM